MKDRTIQVKIKTAVAIKLFALSSEKYTGQIAYIITTARGDAFFKYQYLIIRHYALAFGDETVQDITEHGKECGMDISSSESKGLSCIKLTGATTTVEKMIHRAGFPYDQLPKKVFPAWVTLKIDNTDVVLATEQKQLRVRDKHIFLYEELEHKDFL